MLVDAHKLKSLIYEFSFSPRPDMLAAAESSCGGGWAEPFLQILGAEEVVSVDASAYESCSFVHDLNLPIPGTLKSRFDVVIDGGTLEHVFNFPVAVKNCIDMLSVGGCFLSAAPANNFAGHGFYQFSPELFYRVFSGENGFVIERAFVSEAYRDNKWYRVPDPALVRRRVEFVSARPTYLLIQARKISQVETFRCCPQQSDYATVWEGRPDGSCNPSGSIAPKQQYLIQLLKSVVLRVPGARHLVNGFRRCSADGVFLIRTVRGPWGVCLEECNPNYSPESNSEDRAYTVSTHSSAGKTS
jgi:hypothetical protein